MVSDREAKSADCHGVAAAGGRCRGLRAMFALIAMGLVWHSCGAVDRLPELLRAPERDTQALAPQPWTIADIVQIRHITSTAIANKTRQVAFVVKQSFIDSNDIRYGLYSIARHGGDAKKLLEADFIDQVEWHPSSSLWTVRADLGEGIQLYDVDASGKAVPLVINPRMVSVGAVDSVVAPESDEGPRQTGVASYEWAPDGHALWYSAYHARDISEHDSTADRGIPYDDRDMDVHAVLNDPTLIAGIDLHVLRPAERSDRKLLFVPGGFIVGLLFSRQDGSAFWEKDGQHIQYSLMLPKADASSDFSMWSLDTVSGVTHKLSAMTGFAVFSSVPAPEGQGYLAVKIMQDGRHLVRINGSDGRLQDYGKVGFNGVGNGYGLGAWSDSRKSRMVLNVRYGDHEGLVTVPDSSAAKSLGRIPDNLSNCSFTRDLMHGVCVRESLSTPQELVDVKMENGGVTTSIRVNPTFLARGLHSEAVVWKNRFGSVSDGYITYPTLYTQGQRYPAIVVTHDRSAVNKFADAPFQWEFPIQVLADRGYLVLSVNEPEVTAETLAGSVARAGIQAHKAVSDIQFAEAFNVVATIESAMESAVNRGLVDPAKTGIAGYSRGAEVVEWVMTQSKTFHAAIEGDAGGFTAGEYWLSGWAPIRDYYKQLYGGSPYDRNTLDNYYGLSVSFRSMEFAGPFLQLIAKGNGFAPLELHALLRDARIPTELVLFPNESHIFWGPRHRAAAMQRSIDWFDYWLLRKHNAAAAEPDEYVRWDAMASTWGKTVH